jgi:hypothetical protein
MLGQLVRAVADHQEGSDGVGIFKQRDAHPLKWKEGTRGGSNVCQHVAYLQRRREGPGDC